MFYQVNVKFWIVSDWVAVNSVLSPSVNVYGNSRLCNCKREKSKYCVVLARRHVTGVIRLTGLCNFVQFIPVLPGSLSTWSLSSLSPPVTMTRQSNWDNILCRIWRSSSFLIRKNIYMCHQCNVNVVWRDGTLVFCLLLGLIMNPWPGCVCGNLLLTGGLVHHKHTPPLQSHCPTVNVIRTLQAPIVLTF